MKKKKFTKIRENITEVEHQKLLTYLNGKEHFVFNDNSKDENFIITTKGNPLKTPTSSTFIGKVNCFIQEVLGHRYSSHSFRAGIITDMSKSINPKFIKEFIGHSDIKTTMRYIRPTDEDLKKCLIR
jgi:integrase